MTDLIRWRDGLTVVLDLTLDIFGAHCRSDFVLVYQVIVITDPSKVIRA